MNSVAEDIKDYLVAQSVGTYATDLFIGNMPDEPDRCIALNDTGWMNSLTKYEWRMSGLQILIRDESGKYTRAYTKANLVFNTLHGLVNETLNNTRYACVAAAHDPMFLGLDESNRPIFSINFEVQRTSA